MTTFPRTVPGVLALLVFLLVPAVSAQEGRGSLSAPPPAHAAPAGLATPVPAIECPDCHDDNACTVDSCDTATGFCRHEILDCDDGDPCTTDYCNRFEPSPGCGHLSMRDGAACSAAESCVKAGVCEAGVCRAGVPEPLGTSCETPFDCSEEGATCDGAGHCTPGRSKPGGAPCDDGDFCTTGDSCQDDGNGLLSCQGGTTRSCDDDNPCTIDHCAAYEECVHDPVSCSDGNACTTDTCDPLTGACSHTAGTDSQYCAGPDFCTQGACVAGNCRDSGVPVCADLGCGRGVCFKSNNLTVLCGWAADNSRCDRTFCDAAYCDSQTLVCRGAGACQPTTCSRGSCDSQFQCLNVVPTPGATCSDGDACTVDDVCSANGVCQGTGASCDDGDSCTLDRCDGGICRHDAVPGAPLPEVCNGADDDCDGLVDENRIMANCMIRPVLLFDPGVRTTFAVTCRFRDRCAGNADLPPAGIDPDPIYVSRADRLADPADNVVSPDPASLACPDPQQGSSFEPGIVESAAARVLGGSTVAFNFTVPHDGQCATLDGDRTALLGRMKATPDGLVTVCVSGRYGGSPWDGCAIAILRHSPGSAE